MSTPQLDAARDLYDVLDRHAAATPPGEPMPASSIEALRDAGLLGLLVPRDAGGQELPVIDAVDVYAELSRADGSTGWCHFASDTAAAYFGSYLPDRGVERVFADGVPVMAGQFAPNGTAVTEGDDLVVNGDYQFGSGIVHADWAGAGILATPPDGGDPEYVFGCFPADRVELAGNWDVLGLQATASYDYRLRDVRVARDCTFEFFSPVVHRGGPQYTMAVLPLTAAGHAGWALGVTRRMLDELAAVAAGITRMGAVSSLAESERFLVEYGTLEGRYRAGRAWVRETIIEAQAQVERDGFPDQRLMDLMRQACVHAKQGGADIARQAYLLAGTRALRDGPMQRCFRDLHAGAQHFFGGTMATMDLARGLLADAQKDAAG